MKDARAIRRRAIQSTPLYAVFLLLATTAAADETHPGRTLFLEYQCYQCHGYEGQGGTPGGPRIVSLGYSFEAFAARARHTNVMPAYSPNVLNDEDLKKIFSYLQSIPEPPPVDDFPILRDELKDIE